MDIIGRLVKIKTDDRLKKLRIAKIRLKQALMNNLGRLARIKQMIG